LKKLLSLIGGISLTVAPIATVIACGDTFDGLDDLAVLENDVKERNLGYFDHQPTDQELLDQAVQKNEHLNVSQVHIESNQSGEAKLIVNGDSNVYEQGEIIIYYTDPNDPLIRLGAVIVEIDLNSFDHSPSSEEILSRAKELNSDLHTDEVLISKRENRQAFITVKENSKVYQQGNVEVHYQDPTTLVKISEVINQQDLKTFSKKPSEADLLTRAKSLNNNLKTDEVHVIEMTNSQATIIVNDDSQVYEQGSIVVNYQVNIERIALQDDVRQTDVGSFDSYPDKNEILKRIKERNDKLRENEVHLNDTYDRHAATLVVNDDSTVYQQGSVTITYTVNLRHLEQELTKTELGEFDHQPNEEDILNKAKELNQDLVTGELSVVNKDNENGTITATISVNDNSHIYEQNSVSVTYTFKLRQLSADISITDLGTFEKKPTSEEVIKKAKDLNSNLLENEIEVNQIENNEAFIAVIKASRFYEETGKARVIYSLATQKELSEDLKTVSLGTFDENPNDEDIFARISQLSGNKDVKTDELQIYANFNGEVKIGAKRNSKIYNPNQVTVYYTIKTNEKIHFQRVMTTIELGEFDTQPTDQQIRERISERNPNLNVKEMDTLSYDDQHLTMQVNKDSKVYFRYDQATVTFNYSVTHNNANLTKLSDDVTNIYLGEVE
jgi:hypothetical protein